MVLENFDGAITIEQYKEWLEQFLPEEKPLIEKIVSAFRYYSISKVYKLLGNLHEQILAILNLPLEKIWFVPVGWVAKSGSAIAYFYRKQNNIPNDRFLPYSALADTIIPYGDAIVFLDDFIGSGHQAVQVWNNIPKFLRSSRNVVFSTIIGLHEGIQYVTAMTEFIVIVNDQIEGDDPPLSSIFPNEEERQKALAILSKYGERLFPNNPLGYKGSKALLGFFYSTPNNTFPILWSSEDGWKPLLPRGEIVRDPTHLISSPNIPREIVSESISKPIFETTELERYNIPTEISFAIISEFKFVPILLVLAPIILELKITPDIFPKLIDLVHRLINAKVEQKPVITSVLVIPSTFNYLQLGDTYLHTNVTLDNQEKIKDITELVDGFSGAMVVTATGSVIGNINFKSSNGSIESSLPQRYHKVAEASKISQGLLFLFSGNGKVDVFDKGERILIHRQASWHLYPTDIRLGNEFLSKKHEIQPGVLDDILRICLKMSDEGNGALITIGDSLKVLEYSEPLSEEYFQIRPIQISDSNDNVVISLMSQDGATIVDNDGVIVRCMTTLRPPVGAKGVLEAGTGTKHSTAAKISGISNALSIAVSQSGRITVYSKGEIIYKIMG